MTIKKNIILTYKISSVELSEKIELYRYDSGIEFSIDLQGLKYIFNQNSRDDIIEYMSASKYTITIQKPKKDTSIDEYNYVTIPLTNITDNKIKFIVDNNMTQELNEIGEYSLQVHLYDEEMNRISIPPFKFIVKDLINPNYVPIVNSVINNATINKNDNTSDEIPLFTVEDGYIKTKWLEGMVISAAKLNKIETALDIITNETNKINLYLKDNMNKSIYRGIMDVAKKYNLDTTGSKDCSAKINEAIEFAKKNGINTLYFKAGTYLLKSSIVLDISDFKLLGENCRKTIFKSFTENIIMIDIIHGSRQIIENIGFHGAWICKQTAIGTSNKDVYIARQSFLHLYFYNITYGIYIMTGYMDAPLIFDVWFQTVKGCISLYHGGEGGTIQKVVAEPFTEYCIRLTQANAMSIRDVLANTSKDVYSKDINGSTVFILQGSNSKSGKAQNYGTGVSIEGVHSEYVHRFMYCNIPNVMVKGAYIFNGTNNTTLQHCHTFHFSNAGGLNPENIKLFNIDIDSIKKEGYYDIYKGNWSEKRVYLPIEEEYVTTHVGGFDNLYVDGFNGTVNIPYKIADGVNPTYTIKNSKYTLKSGRLIYEAEDINMDSIPEMPKCFGINAWKDGDMIYYKNTPIFERVTYGDNPIWKLKYNKCQYSLGTDINYTIYDDYANMIVTARDVSGKDKTSYISIIQSADISKGNRDLTVINLAISDSIYVSINENTLNFHNNNGRSFIFNVSII